MTESVAITIGALVMSAFVISHAMAQGYTPPTYAQPTPNGNGCTTVCAVSESSEPYSLTNPNYGDSYVTAQVRTEPGDKGESEPNRDAPLEPRSCRVICWCDPKDG